DRPAAEGHDPGVAGQGFCDDLPFQGPERFFTVLDEDVADGFTGAPFDLGVGVEQVDTESLGEGPAHGGLARTGGANQDREGSAAHRELLALPRGARLPDDQRVQVAAQVADGFRDRVSTELLQGGVGQHQGDHRLGDDSRSRDRGDVAALVVGLGGLARAHVDGVQGPGHGGDGFHCGADPQRVAGAHAAFHAAGPVAAAADPVGADVDLVVGGGTAPGSGAEAVAEFHAFDRLDAHEGPSQPRVEAAVPVDVAAQAGRQPVGDDFDDSAEGVAGLAGVVYFGDHAGAGLRVEAAHRVGVDAGEVLRGGDGGVVGDGDAAHRHDVADDFHAERLAE